MATIADIETFTRFLTKTNTTSLTAANLLILENKYYEEITGKIISETAGKDGGWGDLNYTAFPTFTITMTNGTRAYDLSAISTTPLVILGVEVQDEDGNWHPLDRITLADIHKEEIGEADYLETNGRPIQYLIRDSQLALYPAPDNGVSVTLTSGLKIFYLRTADVFTSAQVTTGTKTPGFPPPWHYLLSWGPAYDFAVINGLPNANQFKREYDKGLKEMLDFISRRDQDVRPIMSNKPINYI